MKMRIQQLIGKNQIIKIYILFSVIRMMEDPDYYKQLKDLLGNNNEIKENINSQMNSNLLMKEYNKLFPNKFKMTIVVRKDLQMSTGKIAAQVAHGALEAYKKSLKSNPDFVANWEKASGSAKIVLQINSLKEILELSDLATKLNITHAIISDAGRTEVEPGTITVIAFGPGPFDMIDKITGELSTFRE